MPTAPIQGVMPTLGASSPIRSERRNAARQPRCVYVTALVLHESQLRIHACRMSVISATGARISSSAELGPGELFLLILMEGLQGKLIRGELIHEQIDASVRNRERRRSPRYHYGVQFLAFVTDPELMDMLRCALPADLAQLHACR